MAFIPKDWKNAPDPSTPISAEALKDLELRLSGYTDAQVTAERGLREAGVAVEETRALTAESALAPKASPALTGTPVAPTAAALTNTTQIATTAFVQTAVSPLAPLASPALTGNPTAPTQAAGNSSTRVATTAFVATSFAPLESPALTNTPSAPTAAPGTSTTQIATTAFVAAAVSGGAGVTLYNGQTTAAGEGALEKWGTLSSAERGVHTSNTAFGWNALKALTGTNGTFALTAETALAGTVINLTGVETKAGGIYAGGTSNTPMIVFKKLTAGVTNPKVNTAYYVVSGTANAFSVATSKGGAAQKVEGAALKTDTEVVLLTSTEDNTAIGSQAGKSLTTGGGNTLVGENAGVNLTSGEENTVVGCEALGAQQTQNSTVAVGFRSLGSNTTGGGNTAVGTSALEQTKTTNELTAVGFKAMQEAASAGKRSVALGYETLKKATGAENTGLGALAGKAITTGEDNTLVGALAGNGITEGSSNIAIGVFALGSNATGSKNVAIGTVAGEKATGSGNVFIGHEAGKSFTGSNALFIANNGTTALIQGVMSATAASQELGFYGVAPVKRAAAITSPAETVAALKIAVDALREAVKKIGITE